MFSFTIGTLSSFNKVAPAYIYSNTIFINRSNSNLYSNLTISSNTLILLNESSATLSVFVKNGATLYLNASGNFNTVTLFGYNTGMYVMKLTGNQNNIYTYNITQIGFKISGISDSLYTYLDGNCGYTDYQYYLPSQIKIISSAC